MGLLETAEDFVLHKALGNAALRLAAAASAYATGHADPLARVGIHLAIDPNVFSLALLGAAHVAGQYMAARFPRACGWMDGL